MLFFSELKGKRIVTEDNILFGYLEDIIFKISEKPLVTKIVVRGLNKEKVIIPIECCLKINTQIILHKNFEKREVEENELFVVKNLLDKQIIDLTGYKLVRVNDVTFQKEGNNLVLTGIDIGLFGIMRWLKLEKILEVIFSFLKIRISQQFLSWADIQPLELTRGKVKLRKAEEKLKNIRPEDLADYLETTTIDNVKKILHLLSKEQAVEVINNLNLNYQINLLRQYKPEKAAEIISLLDEDEAADILLALSDKRRKIIFNLLPKEKKEELSKLLQLSKTPIGDLINNEFLTVSPQNTVKEVIDKIKKETVDFYYLNNIYVVNENKQLIGVFNLHELILKNLETPVYKFMITNPIVLHLTTPKKIALKKIIKYKITTLPVITEDKKIVGVISVDDLLLEEEID